ncbi:Uncharacterized membrane protein [Faunimonas pinastri]|uniref:Uncharacterized membrane protein n=1 Tax=Faunimonas pinastri TaxID=1855383 RepID=A0A1H8Z257_9HYPH|nr:DUF1036 domain-containing protein [Faunimonas pinastri]SEP58446.1 Uncharacterized membrane protein [Faunimonas pinastri]
MMRHRWGRAAATVAIAVSAAFALSSAAHADLRLCNKTSGRVGVAVGYKAAKAWMTEGWWTVDANSCATLMAGPLISEFYYIYAVDYDQGGEWGGSSFMCTRDKEFTVEGVNDCVARGYQRTGFFEVDTGKQSSWTVQLTEPNGRETGGE